MDEEELLKAMLSIIDEANQALYDKYDEASKEAAVNLLTWAQSHIKLALELPCPLSQLVVFVSIGAAIEEKLKFHKPGTGHL